ncbi:competence/damage-inducible protein A [Marinicauda salina]|uniref:Competence/damage-inducible protein A n=1 Tax=Marinicauda salina TaxID=2135793 RepID=A0A2U2BU04_9PROT|nr:molybdopterin-binding protein [Marinicauda salina]PWE17505.1 competence/damage-inducible protein A [Marinicauda salina]
MSETGVTAGIVVIGDEILSGRTRDINIQQIAEFLAPLGVQVKEARVVSDDQDAIVEAVRAMSERYDYAFTTGGIGPTHDDITADAVAAAFDRTIDIREDARQVLIDWYAKSKTELTEARMRMARIPDGASLIDNPVTGAPGFQLENVFVLAGVPKIARGMLEDVADRIEGGTPVTAISVRIEGAREGDLAARLSKLAEAHPEVAIGSYPWFEEDEQGGLRRGVALVARSTDADALEAVRSEFERFAT